MNKLDRLKVSLAEAGWKFTMQGQEMISVAGQPWIAWKVVRDVPGHKILRIEPRQNPLNVSFPDVINISMDGYLGMKLYTVSMYGFTPDEIMPNIQRIARTLTASWKSAEEEWSK